MRTVPISESKGEPRFKRYLGGMRVCVDMTWFLCTKIKFNETSELQYLLFDPILGKAPVSRSCGVFATTKFRFSSEKWSFAAHVAFTRKHDCPV